MIVVFYGKRNTGKTTICREFFGWVKQNLPLRCHYLDSDKLRFVYGLKGFSFETEKALIDKAMKIAQYEASLNDLVLVSISFAYDDQRVEFNDKKGVLWIYLTHDETQRPTNKKEYHNFQEPSVTDSLNTTSMTLAETLNKVILTYKNFCSTSQYKIK